MTAEMADALAELAEEAVSRDDVRVVVITGTGGRLQRRAPTSPATNAHEHFDVRALDGANRIIRAIVGLDKPVRRGRQRHRRRSRLLGRPGGRHHRGQESAVVPARLRADRPDARRRRLGDGGGRDRPGPGDADGPARRAAHRPGGLRRRADHPPRLRRGVRRPRRHDRAPPGRRPAARASPPPSGPSTPPPWTSSTPPSSASGPARPSCCAPPTSPRACAPSPSAASPTSRGE